MGRAGDSDPYLLIAVLITLAVIFIVAAKQLKAAFLTAFIGGIVLISVNDAAEISSSRLSKIDSGKRVTALLNVESTDRVRDVSTRYIVTVLSVDGVKGEGRARLLLRGGKRQTLQPGDVIVITKTRFRKPRSYRNIGGFDYESYLADRGVEGDFSLGSKSRIYRAGDVFNWRRPLEELKAKMRERLKSPNPEVTALNVALVTGDDGTVSQDMRDAFSNAGVAHILSVSGLHIGFAAGACYLIVKALVFGVVYPFRREWASAGIPFRAACWFALIAAVLYGALAGFKFPAMRSTIMAAVYLLAALMGRGRDFYGAFAVAFFVILLFYPWAIFDVGFQLSFAAIFFIAVFMETWWKPLAEIKSGERPSASVSERVFAQAPLLVSGLAASVFASIGTAPIVAYHFNSVPLYGIISNAVIVPISSLSVPLGLFSSLTGEHITGVVTSALNEIIWGVTRWTADLPYSSRYVAAIPTLGVALYYTVVGAIIGINNRRVKFAVFSVMGLAFIVTAAYRPIMARMSDGYQARFVDVGQGDSTVVLWPGGGAMVIDGGPRYDTFDSGRSIIAPILWRQGRTGLDAIIATHDDSDHSGGLDGLSSRVRPAAFMDNGGVIGAESPLRVLRERYGASYRPLKSGDRLSFPGGLVVETLNPPVPPYPYPDEFNNRSLVLKLSLGPVKVLMMGDVSKDTERWLLNSGADLKADVIKIAHHGSDSSSSPEFLDAVGAKTVVISVGRNNVHHHPNKKVLTRLYERGIRVFRTDLHGEVVMTVRQGKLSFDYYSANAAIYGR